MISSEIHLRLLRGFQSTAECFWLTQSPWCGRSWARLSLNGGAQNEVACWFQALKKGVSWDHSPIRVEPGFIIVQKNILDWSNPYILYIV